MNNRFGIRVVGLLALLVLLAGGYRLAVEPLAGGPDLDVPLSTGKDSASSQQLASASAQAVGSERSVTQQRPITLSSGPADTQGALADGDNPVRSESMTAKPPSVERPFWDAPNSAQGDAARGQGREKTSEYGGVTPERHPGAGTDARRWDDSASYGGGGAGNIPTRDPFASVVEREGRRAPVGAGVENPSTASVGENDSQSRPSYFRTDADDASPLSSNPPNWLDTNVQTTSVEDDAAGEDKAIGEASAPTDTLPPWFHDDADAVAAEPQGESRVGPDPRRTEDTEDVDDSPGEKREKVQVDAAHSTAGKEPFSSGQERSLGGDQGPAWSNVPNVGPQGGAGVQHPSVAVGGTYWSIARREYGSEAFQRALQAYNRDHARGEGRIVVPSEASLRQLYPELCPVGESIVLDAATDRSQHVVLSGETIFDIARKELGTAAAWRRIVEANQDQLGEGIELLAPGMRLRIPAARPN